LHERLHRKSRENVYQDLEWKKSEKRITASDGGGRWCSGSGGGCFLHVCIGQSGVICVVVHFLRVKMAMSMKE